MLSTDLAPGFLLAAPGLGDPRFERTVVLLGRHDNEGALGWVLNGRQLLPVGELLVSADLASAGESLTGASFMRPAREGGPVVPEAGWLVYKRNGETEPGEIAVGPQIGVSGELSALKAVLRGEGPSEFLLLLGCAGWGPGQLENEIAAGAWLTMAVDPSLVFETPPERLWDEAYRRGFHISPAAFVNRGGQA